MNSVTLFCGTMLSDSTLLKLKLDLGLTYSSFLPSVVLMLLGFMSLILAVTQNHISKICIPNHVAYTMLPCRKTRVETKTTKALGLTETSWVFEERRLAAKSSESSDYCTSKVRVNISFLQFHFG